MYDLIFLSSAERELKALPEHIRREVLQEIQTLRQEPIPHYAEPLRRWRNRYRIHIDFYRVPLWARIIYSVNDRSGTVRIERIRARSAAYRGLS